MKTKKIIDLNKFNDFNSGQLRADKFYNYNPGETLKNSFGVKMADFPLFKGDTNTYQLDMADLFDGITGLAFTKQYFPNNKNTDYRLLTCSNEYKVYLHQFLCGMQIMFAMPNIQFESTPFIMQCKKDDTDYIMLSGDEKLVVWRTNYVPYTIENVPNITSMCYNDGMIFSTIMDPAYKIWYASDWKFENIGNISENSGYISLEDDIGYARKVVTFDEDIYVFRDYGITKIVNTKGEFTISQAYVSNTRIFPNTVCLCGNEIVFMTIDGIYSFNGARVTKLDIDLSKYLIQNNDSAFASSLGDIYYLALRLNFNDDKSVLCENGDYINNTIVILNITDGSYQILRGVDVVSFCPAKCEAFEKLLVVFNGENSAKIGEISTDESIFLSDPLPKYWSSQNLVDSFNNKMFTKLNIIADEGVKFNLMLDDSSISFTTYQTGMNEFNFKLISKQIKLEISSSNTSARVDKATLEYYEY